MLSSTASTSASNAQTLLTYDCSTGGLLRRRRFGWRNDHADAAGRERLPVGGGHADDGLPFLCPSAREADVAFSLGRNLETRHQGGRAGEGRRRRAWHLGPCQGRGQGRLYRPQPSEIRLAIAQRARSIAEPVRANLVLRHRAA